MSRPIGAQIRALLEASEAHGKPAPASILARRACLDADASTLSRLCRRAQKYGLMTAIEGTPILFEAVDKWRIAIQLPVKTARVKPAPAPFALPRINSVWALAAQ